VIAELSDGRIWLGSSSSGAFWQRSEVARSCALLSCSCVSFERTELGQEIACGPVLLRGVIQVDISHGPSPRLSCPITADRGPRISGPRASSNGPRLGARQSLEPLVGATAICSASWISTSHPSGPGLCQRCGRRGPPILDQGSACWRAGKLLYSSVVCRRPSVASQAAGLLAS
jgi:hypothetical protein